MYFHFTLAQLRVQLSVPSLKCNIPLLTRICFLYHSIRFDNVVYIIQFAYKRESLELQMTTSPLSLQNQLLCTAKMAR